MRAGCRRVHRALQIIVGAWAVIVSDDRATIDRASQQAQILQATLELLETVSKADGKAILGRQEDGGPRD